MTHPLSKYLNHPLSVFLDGVKCSGTGKDTTLTGMGDLQGKWLIPDEKYPEFLDTLHDYLFIKKYRALGFVEQPRAKKSKPFIIDLDFRFDSATALSPHTFNTTHINNFCKELMTAIDYFIDVKEYEKIRFFVTLRPQAYVDKDNLKDGIHVICPDLPLLDDKWNAIRAHLLQKDVINNVFGDTHFTNSVEDIYDKSMGRKQGWMMYGASKPSIPAYNLTHIYSYIPNDSNLVMEMIDINDFNPRQLLELMSVRYNVADDTNEIRPEKLNEYKQLLNNTTPFVNIEQTVLVQHNPVIDTLISLLPQSDNDIKLMKEMVMECLNKKRAEDHDDWIRVGWCLHNINPSLEVFDLWVDFSKKYTSWDVSKRNNIGDLRHDWLLGMRKVGDGPRLGIRSLYKWARDDNPEKYKELIENDINEFIITQTDATHYHIARLMKTMYGSLYIASVDSRNTDWFYYDDLLNMWRHLKQGIELNRRICIDVAGQIQSATNKIASRLSIADNEDDRERYQNKMKQLHLMQAKLYSSGFGESVMKMAKLLFFEDDFINKLNVNPYLFGCANGVLELRLKGLGDIREHVVFRVGRPEDYVSFMAGKNSPKTEAIPYIPYDKNDPLQKEIANFFEKLFPQKDLREYVLKVIASCLEGMNREQLFFIWNGVGSNGKSKLLTLIKHTFGDYQTSIQTTVFTRKRADSGAANPGIITAKCKRFIYTSETEEKEALNTSQMKQMSGEDDIEARGLYKDQDKFTIMGKIFMACNHLPKITSMDNGTWRRIRVIPFVSRFEGADHPDLIAGKENMFLRDNSLDDKIMTWREAFLSLLVHIYETDYIPNGLSPEPAIVKQVSETYKADNDVFAKFRIERVRELRDGYEELLNNNVNLTDIHRLYKSWSKDSGARQLDLKEIEKRCEESFGNSRGKKIYSHIRIFKNEEDMDDFEKEHNETKNETKKDIKK